MKPDWRSLWKLRLEITSLSVREGRLTIPLVSSNEPTARLVVDRIQTELRLLPGDRWELDRFDAESLGAKVSLQGTLTNASAVQNWLAPSSSKGAGGRLAELSARDRSDRRAGCVSVSRRLPA